MKRFLASTGLAFSLALPAFAGAPALPTYESLNLFGRHGGLAKRSAAAAATPAEMAGFWRSTSTETDPEYVSKDTVEFWFGADGTTEMRAGILVSSTEAPDEAYNVNMQAKAKWVLAGGNIITTTEFCRITGVLGDEDCSDEAPDTTALSDYTVTTIQGKKALIIKGDGDPDFPGDDTLYYVGASPAFLVAPLSVSIRPRVSVRGRHQGPVSMAGGFSAALPDGRLVDLRGRTLRVRASKRIKLP